MLCSLNILENVFLLPDSYQGPLSASNSPTLFPVLDDKLVVPSVANLCVSSFVPNTDICDDLYIHCAPKFFIPLVLATVDFKSMVLVSLMTQFNALLDSRCTHHIIQDHSLFHNYAPQSIFVGTTNSGSLEALGTGDVVLLETSMLPLCFRTVSMLLLLLLICSLLVHWLNVACLVCFLLEVSQGFPIL